MKRRDFLFTVAAALATGVTARAGARTCFFSPELDRLLLAVPEHRGPDAELRVYQPD